MSKDAILSEYDFIVAIDASGSMGNYVKGVGSASRWEAMQESLLSFVRDVEKFDTDGIDIVTFGGSMIDKHQGVTSDKVREVFASRAPRGGTPMAEGLQAALALAGKSPKKDFILVFTDGEPDDKAAVADVIRRQANSQTADDECTILFVQVGDDPAASAYLKGLDDNLKGAKFDIVDAKTIAEAEKFSTTADLVIAAISD